jgi:hypothetical protein
MFGEWLKHRREIREMRELDASEFTRIAHELCVTPGDLDTFVRQGPHATDELPKLLKALGIDEKTLARADWVTEILAEQQAPATDLFLSF